MTKNQLFNDIKKLPAAGEATRRSMIFEPHNGYGRIEYGMPLPFGYLSYEPGQPVFELSTIFAYDKDELTAVAMKAAASLEMFTALERIVKALEAKDAFSDLVEYGKSVLAIAGGAK